MRCFRCGSVMYRVVGTAGAKATCTGCSQWVDCARCSSEACGDTKCLGCYNKTLKPAGAPKPSGPPLIQDGFED